MLIFVNLLIRKDLVPMTQNCLFVFRGILSQDLSSLPPFALTIRPDHSSLALILPRIGSSIVNTSNKFKKKKKNY